MLPKVSCKAKPRTAANTVVVVRIEIGSTPKSVYRTTITTTNHNMSITRSLVMLEKWTLPRRVIESMNSSTRRITPNRKSTNAATATFWPTSWLGIKREPASISALPDEQQECRGGHGAPALGAPRRRPASRSARASFRTPCVRRAAARQFAASTEEASPPSFRSPRPPRFRRAVSSGRNIRPLSRARRGHGADSRH